MFGSLLTLLSAGIIGLVGYVWVGNYLRTGGSGGSGGGSEGGASTATAPGPKSPGTLSGKPSRAQMAGTGAGAGSGGTKVSATPPPLPKRTEAQTAQIAKEQSARDAAAAKAAAEAAKAASEKAAKELKEANARDKEAAKAAAAQAAAAAKEAAAKEAAAAKLAQQREKEAKEAAAAAEKERIAAEKAAAAAEKERLAAEAKRAAQAEADRVQAERDRAQAERDRVQAEKERHLREKEREAAEKDAADKKAAKAASLLSMAMASPPALPKRPMLNILHAPTLTESVAFSPSPRESSASGAEPGSARSGGSDAASKAAKAEDHRRQVQWEFVASEEKYISSLNVLMDVYFRPLKVKAEKGSDKISPAEFSLLFSNVEAIWRFHEMMLPALKTSPGGNVAAVLQAHADYLKMYTKYVSDYTPALQTVNKLYKREGFARMIKKQRELPAAEGLDLMSYLIMPVQRVPRYLLLLKELQKWTPAGHPHSASLESAIAKVGKIATFINEETRAQENASLLLQFQHQIQQMPDDVVLFQPHRRLVRHGLLRLVKQEGTTVVNQLPLGQSYMIILFNDMALYATVDWIYRGSLKLQDAKLNVDGLLVELVKEKTASRRAQMSLRLECPSAEEATRWAHSLRESIKAANELGLQDEKRRAFNSAAFVR